MLPRGLQKIRRKHLRKKSPSSGSRDGLFIHRDPVSTHPERSLSLAISARMSERGNCVTRDALFKSQPSRCPRSDGNKPLLSLRSHHHPPCPPLPTPPTPPSTSSPSITHLRLQSRSVTTMARWVSGQRPSSPRGWPRSSASPRFRLLV